ncbi:MAG: ammonium transporter [Planctomycetota bacterium]
MAGFLSGQRLRFGLTALGMVLCLAGAVLAQEPGSAPESDEAPTLESVAAAADEAKLAAHNAWMLTCCALVLFMTAPGLAMFYGGLVRKKNVLSVMMQCLFLMGLMTVLWALYGYSLAFGGDNPYIGNGDYLMMNDVQRTWPEGADGPVEPMEGVIPRLTHMLFQGMFFIITPALICGAFAERMKFSAMAVFLVLWGTVVYCPLCHWVWGGGILAFGGENSWSGGALDFAGGTVVHISSGISALVCALVIGRRNGWGQDDMRPHNLTYTALGAAMLWVGWFGFNAGSELASDHLTASAFAVTHFSAAAGAVAWAAYEWLTRGKPSVLGVASGAVAGLVCITPAAGFVNPMPALIMGAAAGVVCAIACGMKSKFGYDDALDAFGVHGVGGTLGAILTGVFATRACWDIAEGEKLGLIEGGTVMQGQLVATAVTWIYSIVVTYILLKIVDVTIGLRIDEQGERQGLDLADHEEEGYILT